MRWIWIFLWVALSTIQLVFVGMKRLVPGPVVPHGFAVEDDLVELARETNLGWSLMDSFTKYPGSFALENKTRDVQIRREEWILLLSELQECLAAEGVEIRLMEDLERWLSLQARTEANGLELSKTDSFLSGVYHWFDPFLFDGHTEILVRAHLEPGTVSSYPDLYFELNGIPGELGNFLLQSSGETSDWKLREMDMYRREDLVSWWMQGSCAFMPAGNP